MLFTEPSLRTLCTPLPMAGLTASAILLSSALFLYRTPTLRRRLRLLYKKHILGHTIPLSVNYHFTRKCNATCAFCFHTETDSHHEEFAPASRALKLLRDDGMQKLNFAGGEPFLYPKLLGQLCAFAKKELGLESVTIVSNGTKVTEKWLREHGRHIDILAISCDSFHAETNRQIGRVDRASRVVFDNVEKLFQVRDWCKELGIKFKLNTVVCSLNWDEDMVDLVTQLAPFRWKVFQTLIVKGENENEERIRDARKMAVTKEQFDEFCRKHEGVPGFTPEPNDLMRKSYLILDEYLRFLSLDRTETREHSESILEVGVQKALGQVEWDEESFRARGGIYEWSREGCDGQGSGTLEGVEKKDLEW